MQNRTKTKKLVKSYLSRIESVNSVRFYEFTIFVI